MLSYSERIALKRSILALNLLQWKCFFDIDGYKVVSSFRFLALPKRLVSGKIIDLPQHCHDLVFRVTLPGHRPRLLPRASAPTYPRLPPCQFWVLGQRIYR
jgi:hypothetical protein